MIKYWLFLPLLLISGVLQAQKIFWSDISGDDIIAASEISRSFLMHLEKQHVDSMQYLLAKDSVYTGSGGWLGPESLIRKLLAADRGISVRNIRFTGYRFDDFLETYQQNKLLEGIYPVFDNHSILVRAEHSRGSAGEPVSLVMKKTTGRWQVAGIHGFGLSTGQFTGQDLPDKGFRIERIPEAGIEIPVPEDFSKPERTEGQVIFSLQQSTERDAVFQVLIDELKAKVHYYTYKFVEFSNQQHDLSDLVVRYLPHGILFEYTVKDPYGIKNKGITMGMQVRGKMVIVQYYAFYDIFKKREQEIQQVFNNIRS
jgi:hypothetical protein